MISELPQYIELETSRFCNRRCEWCPNGSHDYRRDQELMAWQLFCKILNDLKTVGYHGWLAFHNYNEPLANPRLQTEIIEARALLPQCLLSLFSNGDYLDVKRVEELSRHGIRYLRITLYPARAGETFNKDESIFRIESWLGAKRLKTLLPWDLKESRQGVAATGSRNTMRIEVISPNLATYNQRGGTAVGVSVAPRHEPCHMTWHSAAIDFRGRMKMCCNVFPEAVNHGRYVVGDLNAQTFGAIWSSEAMHKFRRMHTKADWSSSPICRLCTQRLPREQTEIIAHEWRSSL